MDKRLNAARISLPTPETMSGEQREVYDAVVQGRRGTLIGPLRAALHNPELADRWQRFGEILRYRTTLPARLSELAIIVTARRWNSELEWVIHAEEARQAGLGEAVIDALRAGEPPVFAEADEAEIYAYVRELQNDGQVSQASYDAVLDRWSDRGVVELTAVVGYYTMVSMTLNAHHIPLPEGTSAELVIGGEPPRTLTELPAATRN